jgi:hypothetical protein
MCPSNHQETIDKQYHELLNLTINTNFITSEIMKNSLIQKYNVPGQDILAIQQYRFGKKG